MKSNALARAAYSASIESQRLLAVGLCELRARAETRSIETQDDLVVSFPVKVLKDLFPAMGRSKTLYERVRDKRKELTGLQVDLVDDRTSRFSTWVLVTNADYENGIFTIRFNVEMRKHLTNLTDGYLAYKLMYIAQLETALDQRLYEICRSWMFKKVWTTSYDDLRTILKLEKISRYSLVGNFKKDVLAPFLSRVSKTDIKVTVDDVRVGRRITGFTFHISQSEHNQVLTQAMSEAQKRVLLELRQIGVSSVVAHKLVMQYEVAYIQDQIAAAKAEKAAGHIKKSFTGWLLSAIRDGYDTLSAEQKAALQKRRRVEELIAVYESAPDQVRVSILDEFKRTVNGSAIREFFDDDGLGHPLVRTTMAGFLKSVGPRYGLDLPTQQ